MEKAFIFVSICLRHICLGTESLILKICESWQKNWINLSFHLAFHPINLSKECFFLSNQIGSNETKQVFEVGDERSPIIVKQHGCLVDVLGIVRTNSSTKVQSF